MPSFRDRAATQVANNRAATQVANARLLEMRRYDERLAAELPRMPDSGEAAPRGDRRRVFGVRRSGTMVAEVTERTEQLDNALQVTDDVYPARIYTAALDLFG